MQRSTPLQHCAAFMRRVGARQDRHSDWPCKLHIAAACVLSGCRQSAPDIIQHDRDPMKEHSGASGSLVGCPVQAACVKIGTVKSPCTLQHVAVGFFRCRQSAYTMPLPDLLKAPK